MTTAVIIVRHAERLDYVTPGWTQEAERPWDTPLTPNGHDQAKRAGGAILALCAQHALPHPSVIYSSPLVRCVETATNIAMTLAVDNIRREPSLAETVCESWYKSWAFRGISNSSWGGPRGFEWDTIPPDTIPELLHPSARLPVSQLYLANSHLQAIVDHTVDTYPKGEEKVSVKVEPQYVPYTSPEAMNSFTYGSFESDEQLVSRLSSFLEHACRERGDGAPIVCVSHGGPCGHTVAHMSATEYKSCPYTGVSLLVLEEGKWVAKVTSSAAHLQNQDQSQMGFATAGKK